MTFRRSSLAAILLWCMLLQACHPLFATAAAAAVNVNVADGVLVDDDDEQQQQQSCTWEDRDTCAAAGKEQYRDPNLVPLTVDFSDHRETVYAYVTPDVATFYNETPGSMKKLETDFRGQFGKFINMSPQPIRVYWVPKSGDKMYIADVAPFGSAGTATHPNHKFDVTDKNDPNNVLHQWTINESTSLYKYDPYESLEKAKKELKSGEFNLYKLQYESLSFDKVYRMKTGRQWLALFGRKNPPRFPMWPADSFGQTHQVVTNETHFISQPPDELAKAHLSPTPTANDVKIREQLKPYRSPEESLTLNMTVLSVAPRVFEIQNFLSNEEVTHILELAMGITLSRSTTRAGDAADATTSDATRTSLNSWIARQRTAVVDSIYRRAADLLQIDEACFRNRKDANELELVVNSTGPITERLQLVHYQPGQQYTPHHVSMVLVYCTCSFLLLINFNLDVVSHCLSVVRSIRTFRCPT
jgi:hypothetical protein